MIITLIPFSDCEMTCNWLLCVFNNYFFHLQLYLIWLSLLTFFQFSSEYAKPLYMILCRVMILMKHFFCLLFMPLSFKYNFPNPCMVCWKMLFPSSYNINNIFFVIMLYKILKLWQLSWKHKADKFPSFL